MGDAVRQNRNKRKRQRKREKQRARYGGNKSLQSSSAKLNNLMQTVSKKEGEKSNASTDCEKKRCKLEGNGSGPSKGKQKVKRTGVKVLEHLFQNVKSRNLAEVGSKILEWMISPTPLEDFLSNHFEKKHVLVQRPSDRSFYSGMLSKADIEAWLDEDKLRMNEDMTMSRYVDGKRHSLHLDPPKKVKSAVWKDFSEPTLASLRLLRPQQHADMLWKIVASLESFFGCCGGANAYLTPASSQGFAPHYDDIDAFILQLEGKKTWKVYKPYEGSDEELMALFPRAPRMSSRDFTEAEIKNLKCVAEVTLEEGDLLYIPRGYVHQARSSSECHSLHVTISTGQKNTWGDLLLKAIPRAIETACRDDQPECLMLRQSLPREYHKFMGVMHSDKDDERRLEFTNHVLKIVQNLVLERIDVDLAADQVYSGFLYDRHRPRKVLENDSDSSSDSDEDEDESRVKVLNTLSLDSEFKLTVRDAARLTVEDDAAVVYHSLKNTRKYHETDPRGLEFEVDDAEAIEMILQSNPESAPLVVKNLPHDSDKDRLRVVQFLLEERIITLV